MASMYFLVPINKINKCMLQKRVTTWHPIECQAIFQSISAKCYYAAIPYYNQPFYYNTVLGNSSPKEKRVKLNVNILHYVPSTKEKMGVQYFLAIGTYIDKYFENINNGANKIIEISDAQDLVMLKRAFYSESDRNKDKTGLYYPKEDPVVFHRLWLEEIVKDFDLEPNRNIAFDASATSIWAVSSNSISTVCPTTPQEVKSAFEDNYYDDKPKSYDQVLDGIDANRFAYGVTEGNENFASLPEDLINIFVANSYSNNYSERFFTAPNRLTFFCTHFPYVNLQESKDCRVIGSLTDIDPRMLYELCHSLYYIKESNVIRAKIGGKSKLEEIKKLSELFKIRLYNMSEADNRLRTLYKGLGVFREFENSKEDVEAYLISKNYSYSKRNNRFSLILTFVSLVATLFSALVAFEEVRRWITTNTMSINGVYYNTFSVLIWGFTFLLYFLWIEFMFITDRFSWAKIKNRWKCFINTICRKDNGKH